MMSYCAFCPVPVRVLKTGNRRTVPIRPSSALRMFWEENFAPGSDLYFPSPRYLSKPVEIHADSFDEPTVPLLPSRLSIPNAPGAPIGSKLRSVLTKNFGFFPLLLQ